MSLANLKSVGLLQNLSKRVVLADNVLIAESFSARLKGLLGENALAANTCLWIKDCRSIHTWFMRFPIDAVFVDKNLVVKKVVRNMGAWGMTLPIISAESVFEFQAGATEGKVEVGEQLNVGY